MVSPPVAGRYALYKEGTVRIVCWLKTEASHISEAVVNGLFEGKSCARDLIVLATAVSCAQTVIDIPGRRVELLDEFVEARAEFATWWSTQPADSSVKADNLTHQHFIKILGEVRKFLLHARTRQRGTMMARHQDDVATAHRTQTVDPLQRIDNNGIGQIHGIFFHLELNEPSQNPLGSEPQRYISSTKDTNNLGMDARTEKALHCGASYMTAAILSVLAASMTTEVAFGMMRRADNELATVYPDFRNADLVVDYLGYRLDCRGPAPALISRKLARRAFETSLCKELLFPGAQFILWCHLQECKFSADKPAYFEASQKSGDAAISTSTLAATVSTGRTKKVNSASHTMHPLVRVEGFVKYDALRYCVFPLWAERFRYLILELMQFIDALGPKPSSKGDGMFWIHGSDEFSVGLRDLKDSSERESG
ncbi:hypothetical protein BAUCODRAFT_568129 [Baudoinia panamericana UAMH 10762]|uniref:DUF6604 domain-containing protein n=1 Tax=Baudoinia panamericana (strain UAMH 10762) TaxID=717646 RepID=M2MA11_BAUPA|nr:uncharacterized protein BAUCODRAFT_568129 [Baudoinia panamericana UAMH 10762]EMC93306.1 hypothetical protein BAUCODRAFT_568129 [Baudoinia panamericana UAMH 10762]